MEERPYHRKGPRQESFNFYATKNMCWCPKW